MARRLGTSRCSVILPKEIRRGANALDELMVFAGREAAKMRPSEDRCCGGRFACSPTGPPRKRPHVGHFQQRGSRKTAQTSSVAERLTAVESPPVGDRKTPLTSGNPKVETSRHRPCHSQGRDPKVSPEGGRWPWRPRKVVLLQPAWIVVTQSRVATTARRVFDRTARRLLPEWPQKGSFLTNCAGDVGTGRECARQRERAAAPDVRSNRPLGVRRVTPREITSG